MDYRNPAYVTPKLYEPPSTYTALTRYELPKVDFPKATYSAPKLYEPRSTYTSPSRYELPKFSPLTSSVYAA